MYDLFSLRGRRAIVTGANRGIGESLALTLLGSGADVVLAVRQTESLDRLLRSAEALGLSGRALMGRALPVAMDVRDVASIRAGVAAGVEAFGGIDILINNAGVTHVEDSLALEEEDWDCVVDTNLKGAFFVAQAAARAMAEGRGGSIVNICAASAFRAAPAEAAYAASKAGLFGLTRTLAAEWGGLAIRVNALAPAYVATDMTLHLHSDDDWRAEMLERLPISRFSDPGDLAGAMIFLCSDASKFVTGACLPVDGGFQATF